MNLAKWLKSKTFWAQFAVVLVGVQQIMPDFQFIVSGRAYGYVLFAIAVVNIIIRAFTTKPVAEK